ncbi:MAG: ferredoxin family protein, partial [Coriobacteriia bacterium]
MAAAYFVHEPGLRAFVDALVGSRRVVAPVAKRGKFVFEELSSADDLRLDYDVTILPPKKVFFPPAQPIVRFSGDEVSGCTCAVDTVLLGVHFYDVKAIDQLDYLMRENNADWDYLCQREATTVVASNIQAVMPRAFWDSVATGVEPQGHDAFLTKIGSGYVLETRTEKGEALIAHGSFRQATQAEVEEARAVNDAVMGTCPERLEYTTAEIAERVRDSYSDEKLWDELAERCFSCGSCNTVCP